MPELSRFFGIIIRMYAELTAVHHTPHFHVYYQDHSAVYSIDSIAMITGYMPRRQQRLVEAWGELHVDELQADWELLMQGKLSNPIKPLE
jgi:hypothetical protein